MVNDSDEDENEFFDAISEHSDSDFAVRGSQESIQSSTSSESYGKDVEAKPLLPKKIEEKLEGEENGKPKDNTVTTLATVFPQGGAFAAMSSYVS